MEWSQLCLGGQGIQLQECPGWTADSVYASILLSLVTCYYYYLLLFFGCSKVTYKLHIILTPDFLAMLHSMQAPSSPTRDQAHTSYNGSAESQPLDLQGNPSTPIWNGLRRHSYLLLIPLCCFHCLPLVHSTWKVKVLVAAFFATLWTAACQALLSVEFFRQEYWSGLPFPSPGYLPDLRIKPGSPALQADSLPSELPEWGCKWYSCFGKQFENSSKGK